jgi:hypothetical protein
MCFEGLGRAATVINLAELGVGPRVVERVLNDSTGTRSGVAAIFNRFLSMHNVRTP